MTAGENRTKGGQEDPPLGLLAGFAAEWRSALIGIVGAVVGAFATIAVGGFGYLNRDKELDLQMLEVGLSILRGESTGDADTEEARRFAIRMLMKTTGIEVEEDAIDKWAGSDTPIPYESVASPPPEADSFSRALAIASFCLGEHSIQYEVNRANVVGHRKALQIFRLYERFRQRPLTRKECEELKALTNA